VRQTRTMIYEKIDSAKIFFFAFPVQTRAPLRFVRVFLRQTRTRFEAYGDVFFDN
jgi:hypothetical protein